MGRVSRSALVLGIAASVVAAGGAYALASSLAAGQITVCVRHKGGTLYKAKKCVKHDKKLSWNKHGRRGATGATGATGPQGGQGPQGPGAHSFAMTLTNGTGKTAVVAVGNGLELSAGCSGFQIQLYIDTTSGNPNSLQMSGTATGGTTGGTLMIEDSNNTASGAEMNGNVLTDFDVIARDSTNGGKFARIDFHGTYGSPCTFWGMVTPSS